MIALAFLLACGEPTQMDLAEKDCASGDLMACTALGQMFQVGEGGADKNPSAARRLFKKACDGDHAPACVLLGQDALSRAQDTEAADALKRACDLGDPEGCVGFGVTVFEKNLLPRRDEAIAALDRGCQAKVPDACALTVEVLAVTDEPDLVVRAIAFGAEQCTAGDPGSCNNAAWFWAVQPNADHESIDGVALARKAVEHRPGDPAIEDTLAAALARAGQFDEAIEVQERVVQAAQGTPQAEIAQARLEGYQKGLPWTERRPGVGYADTAGVDTTGAEEPAE